MYGTLNHGDVKNRLVFRSKKDRKNMNYDADSTVSDPLKESGMDVTNGRKKLGGNS
jgi:hypothetical protein